MRLFAAIQFSIHALFAGFAVSVRELIFPQFSQKFLWTIHRNYAILLPKANSINLHYGIANN